MAKNRHDRNTSEIHHDSQRRAEENYVQRQRDMGRKARKFWLTDTERAYVAAHVAKLRDEHRHFEITLAADGFYEAMLIDGRTVAAGIPPDVYRSKDYKDVLKYAERWQAGEIE